MTPVAAGATLMFLPVGMIRVAVLLDVAVRPVEDTVLHRVPRAWTTAVQMSGTSAAAVAVRPAAAMNLVGVIMSAVCVTATRMAAATAPTAMTSTAVLLRDGLTEDPSG